MNENDKKKESPNTEEIIEVVTSKPADTHYLIWHGPYAVCTSCKYPHTIPIDPKRFDIVNGTIVKKNHQ